MLKEAPLHELVRAIKSSPTAAPTSTRGSPGSSPARSGRRLPSLTKREREVLRMLADGMRNDQVASVLSISPLTVRTHVKNAMEKLEADTRTHAVARASVNR